jgi:uncharacterized protein
MKIDILNLKDGTTEYFEKLDSSALDLSGLDCILKGSLDAHTIVEKSGNKVKITIDTAFALTLKCSRCLEDFDRSFSTSDTYFVRPGHEEEPEKYLSEEDVYTIFAATQEVDTVPLIRDALILSIPMKPLCNEDCKGICPVCGANLNLQTCSHREGTSDSEWQKILEDIKKKIDKK